MMPERWADLCRQFEIRNLLLRIQADSAAKPRWKFRGTYERKRHAEAQPAANTPPEDQPGKST